MRLNTVKDIIDNVSYIKNVSGGGDDVNQMMLKSIVDDFGVDKETALNFVNGEIERELPINEDKHIYCLTVYWTATDIKYDLTRGKFVAMMSNGYDDVYEIEQDEVRFRYVVDNEPKRFIDIVQKDYTELVVAKDDVVLGMDFLGDGTYKMYHFKRFFNDSNDVKTELDSIIDNIKKRVEIIENNAYMRFRSDLLKIDSDVNDNGGFTVDVKAMMRDMEFSKVEKEEKKDEV